MSAEDPGAPSPYAVMETVATEHASASDPSEGEQLAVVFMKDNDIAIVSLQSKWNMSGWPVQAGQITYHYHSLGLRDHQEGQTHLPAFVADVQQKGKRCR